MYDDISIDKHDDGVGVLTLRRPSSLNALTRPMILEIREAVRQLDADDDVRALVIVGEGRAFCAGDDVNAIFMSEDPAVRRRRRAIERITRGDISLDVIYAMEKPTIAAVRGPAVGYGMDIALYCDIRIASTTARFASLFVKRGVVGSIGSTYILPRLVGFSRAIELALTGETIDADEALSIGLVSRVVADDELVDSALGVARTLAAGPPLAQRAIKRAMHKGFDMPWRELAEYQQALGDVLWETDDHQEGVRSYVEKRAPKFRGR